MWLQLYSLLPCSRAKSGMQRFQNREEQGDRLTFTSPLARIHESSTPKSGANPRSKAHHGKIPRISGHQSRLSRGWKTDCKHQCHPELPLGTNWSPDLETKIALDRA